jgi:hypothetical protein
MMNSVKDMFSRLTTITPLEKQPENVITTVDSESAESINVIENPTLEHGFDEKTASSESINVIENPTLEDGFDENLSLTSESSPNRSWNSSPDIESVYIYHTDTNYNYREFFYLHENRLAKEYTCYDTKNIHICTFAMNHSCSYQEDPLPFLQFLLAPSENKWVFPHFQFQCSQQLDFENTQNYFLNACIKCMLDSFVIEGHLNKLENINKLYRGYIECGENDIVVVFDMTSFVDFMLRKQTMWFIVSEVSNQNIVSSFVSDFFGKHAYMTRVETQHNVMMELPHMLYLYDVERHTHMKHPLTLLEPRSFHPSYGHFYYFVKEHPEGSPQQYVRCAVFMENITVVDEESEPFSHITEDSVLPGSPSKDLGDSVLESSPSKDLGDSVLESSPSKDLGDSVLESSPSKDLGDSVLESSPSKDLGDSVLESSPSKDLGDSILESSPSKDLGNSVSSEESMVTDDNSYESSSENSTIDVDDILSDKSSEDSLDELLESDVVKESVVPEIKKPLESRRFIFATVFVDYYFQRR